VAWSFVRLIAGQGEGTDLESVASPASPAFLYGLHHLAALEMNRPSDYSIEPVGADLRACDAMACFTFGGFRIDRDGRIRTFSVDDQPVDGRVTSGHRLGATAEGVTVVVKTAVVSTRGHLNVVFEVTNDRSQPLTTLPDRARYLPVDGTPVASPEDVLREPFEIPPGALLRTMAVFDHSRFGGALVFVARRMTAPRSRSRWPSHRRRADGAPGSGQDSACKRAHVLGVTFAGAALVALGTAQLPEVGD
jgi:hypothetical protein